MISQYDKIVGLRNHRGKGGFWESILLSLVLLAAAQNAGAQQPPGKPQSTKANGPTAMPPTAAGTKLSKAVPSTVINDVTSTQDGQKLIVSVATTGATELNEFTLDNPPRLVVDLINAECKVPALTLPLKSEKVRKLRVRQFQSETPKIARLVFDLTQSAIKHEISKDDHSVRVVFDEAAARDATPKNTPDAKAANPAEAAASGKSPATPNPPLQVQPKSAEQTAAPVAKPKPYATMPPAPVVKAENEPMSKAAAAAPAHTEHPVQVKPKSPEHTTAAVPKPKPSATTPAAPAVKAENEPMSKAAAAVPTHTEHPVQMKPKSPEHTATSVAKPKPSATTPVVKVEIEPLAKAGVVAAPIAQAVVMLPQPKTVSVSSPPPPEPNGRFFGKPLTLDLVDVSLVDFFRLMSEEGEINIVMDPEIKGNLSIKVVKVPWDQIFEAALTNNGLDKQIEGNLVRIARKATLQEEAKQREALKKANLLAADLETRIKRLNYTKATGLVPALKEHQSVRGTVAIDERTNSLVMSDIPESINKMIALVETLDIPQPQVEIEARIVSATRDFARDIGVQFGFVQGNLQRVTVGGPNTFGTIGGTRPAATPTNTFSAGNPITGRGASENQSSQSAGVSTGSANKGNFNVNLPSQKPFGGLGISIGNIFDTFLLDAAITAGENKGLAKLISQPKVTAQNNSPATITQGLRFPVQIVANNTITVQFQNAALTLNVTPQITLEGNIVLDLKIENNTPDFGQQVNGIPSIRTSESQTRVLVSDGGTTVIGGILIDNETTQEDRVPGLASLPIVGNVFRRSAVSHSTQEVLFFITPRVIK